VTLFLSMAKEAVTEEAGSAPVSRILSRNDCSFPDDHLSGAGVTADLGATLLYGRAVRLFRGYERSCFRWGLPELASPRSSVSSYLILHLPYESPDFPHPAKGAVIWRVPAAKV